MPSWILAIDFGTSYTVAASKVGDRSPEVIEVGGERRMPSVVMVDEGSNIIVGRTADDLSSTHPGSTLRALKNRLGDQAPVVLDGRPYQVVNLVAALLRHVYSESVRQMGSAPAEVRLTHPATWNRPRLNRLLEAAAKAELPSSALVPEPVAAALSFASEVGVAPGAHVAVYDLGGGTFDSAIVTASGGGFNIVGRPGGDQTIGGELFDEIIVNHLGEQLPPTAWDAIQIGDEPLWQQVASTLRNEARKAKETLSGNPYADLIVPLPTGLQQLRITREEFEDLVRPYLTETVALLDRCVTEAGISVEALSGISLVGGSSRSPIVERMVTEAFPRVPVIRRGDPKTSVASGAARAVRSAVVAPPVSTGQVTQEAAAGTAPQAFRLAPPMSDPPVAPAGPVTPPPVAPSAPVIPVLAAAAANTQTAPSGPVSNPPAPPPGPVSNPPAPVAKAPLAAATTIAGGPVGATVAVPAIGAPGAPGPPPGVPGGFTGEQTKKPKSKTPLVILGVVAVAAIIAGAVVFLNKGSDDSSSGLPTRKTISAALLPVSAVRDELGDEYEADKDIGYGEPFCAQFELAVPVREGERLFIASDGEGEDATERGFYQSIGVFADASEAETYFKQEKAVTQRCATSTDDFYGTPVTYTLTDVSDDASDVGEDVVAIKYEAAPTDGSGDVILTGYLIEALDGGVVMGSHAYVYNDDFQDSDFRKFIALTKTAFQRVHDQL